MSGKAIPLTALSMMMLPLLAVGQDGSGRGRLPGPATVPAPPYDVNDPNWSPSDCFVPAWSSARFSTELFNPDEHPNRDANDSGAILSISINLYKAQCERLLDLNRFARATNVQAVDDQDRVLAVDSPSFSIRSYSPDNRLIPRPSVFADRPERVTVNFPMNELSSYPTHLKELSWSHYGLFANSFTTVDLPFAASNLRIEILPGYSVQIEEAVSDGRTYSYRYNTRYACEGPAPSRHVTIREGEELPKYVDMGIKLLDAEGRDVHATSSGGGSSGSSGGGSGTTSTRSGRGSCEHCGEVTTIRFKFAVDPYEAELAYHLTDIPLPTF